MHSTFGVGSGRLRTVSLGDLWDGHDPPQSNLPYRANGDGWGGRITYAAQTFLEVREK